ncbi:hypothetical protein CsSME_00003849 [Camellia sinensis var. sinensis]
MRLRDPSKYLLMALLSSRRKMELTTLLSLFNCQVASVCPSSSPSYRGSSFLDPKGRGGSTGYDSAVALPAGGRGDEEELVKENIKNTASSTGKITLGVTNSKPETGEVIGVFESIQPSDTDLGAKVPKEVKIQGVWYAQLE